jgi:uncharacterized membrane protein
MHGPVTRTLRLPLIVLSLVTVAWAGHLAFVSASMPERVATHFGLGGIPNGWMSRSGFVEFSVIIVLVVSLVLIGAAWLVRKLPVSLVNMPNRDYWLAPERREEASRRMLRYMLWLLSGMVAFFAAINQLLFQANSMSAPRLDESHLVAVVAVFLLGMLVSIVRLFSLFALPRQSGR